MTDQLAQAIQMINSGQREAARSLCEQLQQTDGDNPGVIHLSGVIAAQDNHSELAIERFKRAVSLKEDWPEAHCNLAAVYRSTGQFDASKEQLQRALHFDPGCARAYFYLSQVDSYRDRQLLDQVLAAIGRPPLSHADQCLLRFSAGKLCDDLNSFDEAFYHYALGNVSRHAKFDPVHFVQRINRMIESFDHSQLATRSACGNNSRLPIFVVGMPRSGTSLLEHILASHPRVHGAGELPDIPAISQTLPQHANQREYPECMSVLENRILEGFGGAYLRRLEQIAKGEGERVVDKNPGNFMHVGLIAAMFPQATIIHCKRHPLSTCLSCYFQNFASQHDYTFHQTHLGLFYAQYERMMQHWHDVLPGRILDFSYEQLIAEPAAMTRKLLDGCGLTWDDHCLAPHRTGRAVSTASAWEVRQPIYQSSLERWRNYETHLGPLRNALAQTRAQH